MTEAAVAVLVVLAASPPAHAQEPDATPTATVSVDLASNYVWRGLRLSDGLVAQASLAGEYKGFAAGVWSNYDPRDFPFESGRGWQFTEADLSLSYGWPFLGGTLTGGIVHYAARAAADTSELFVSYEVEMPLQASAAFYLDVDEGDGGFLAIGVARSLGFVCEGTLDLSAEAGFNVRNETMGLDEGDGRFTGPYHGELSAVATVPLRPRLTLTGRLALSTPLGSRAAYAIASSGFSGDTRTCLYGAVGLVLSLRLAR